MAALSEQEIIRREKLEKIKALGINPYPAALYPVNESSASIKNNYVEGKEVIVAGRLMSRRIQGKASFALLAVRCLACCANRFADFLASLDSLVAVQSVWRFADI